jgi:hypothetical protein
MNQETKLKENVSASHKKETKEWGLTSHMKKIEIKA